MACRHGAWKVICCFKEGSVLLDVGLGFSGIPVSHVIKFALTPQCMDSSAHCGGYGDVDSLCGQTFYLEEIDLGLLLAEEMVPLQLPGAKAPLKKQPGKTLELEEQHDAFAAHETYLIRRMLDSMDEALLLGCGEPGYVSGQEPPPPVCLPQSGGLLEPAAKAMAETRCCSKERQQQRLVRASSLPHSVNLAVVSRGVQLALGEARSLLRRVSSKYSV